MIYILTGIAKSGKSYVAKRIQKEHNLSIFSTDYIMMMLHYGNPQLKLDIDASDRSVAKEIQPYVHGLIQVMIDNNDSFLIEGVHFNPDFCKELLQTYPNNIKILNLGYKDISTKEKVEELTKNKANLDNPWLFHHHDPIETIVAYMIQESKRLYQDCVKYDLPYIDIYNIEEQTEDIMKLLIKKEA